MFYKVFNENLQNMSFKSLFSQFYNELHPVFKGTVQYFDEYVEVLSCQKLELLLSF